MENRENIFAKRTLSLTLIIFGWVLCGYLVYRSSHLNSDGTGIPDLCVVIFGGSCDKAITGVLSRHLGFPLTGCAVPSEQHSFGHVKGLYR